MSLSRIYILFDGRAISGNTDIAQVLEALGEFNSLEKARRYALKTWDGHDAVIVSYTDENGVLCDETVHGIL